MENKSNNKTLMILMIICVCLSITTLGIVIYDRFIRKEPEPAVLKPIDLGNQMVNDNENNDQLKKELNTINNQLMNLLSNTSKENFEIEAKKYLSDEMISKLLKYYDNDTKSFCLDTAACGASGGYFLEETDIMYRDFEIVSVSDKIIKANGIYGESSTNTNKTEIIYTKENGIWKIKSFEIK